VFQNAQLFILPPLATRRKPTAHLSTFGFCTPKKPINEKPKELKFWPTQLKIEFTNKRTKL